jgi:hypothetical protein
MQETLNTSEKFLERNFRLTWKPDGEHVKPILVKKKARTIHFKNLPNIVGDKKASFIVNRLIGLKEDSIRFRVQNKGTLYVYCQ